ncbi:MAG TPA: type II CRISPR-associated endonuclease Cas1 [Elusimicrobiales bacterium]|nr:type II CRISPR-associated endonuclease Cas1 [Elusimicrobiales bacterium]
MSWRILTISKPSELFAERFQLVCRSKETQDEQIRLPLEDIAALIIESRESSISSWLLSECAERGIAVFSCDETHTPSGLFLPFMGHSRFTEMAWLQQSCSEPFKKRCWQRLIQAKIRNQAKVLRLAGKKSSVSLPAMASRVQSGDAENYEGQAARVYWEALFDSFSRDANDKRNSALNYGYAILRGAVARAISGAGLLPCFGLHHANKLNAFNLADDLLEPYRPFVDLKVLRLIDPQEGKEQKELSLAERQRLVAILSDNAILDGKQEKMLSACEKSVFSLACAMRQKDPKALLLPEIPLPQESLCPADGRD